MHRLRSMSQIKITESAVRGENLIYIKETLYAVNKQLGCIVDLRSGKNRCELSIDAPSSYRDLVVSEVEDKIADVIAINYKYSFFKRNVNLSGLKPIESELLLTTLISADIDEDKRYVVKKLKSFQEYALDGIFNFRMKPLKEKWYEILTYIPPEFQPNQLKEFIIYLIKDKNGKKVYFDDGCVYDKRYNLLKRRALLFGDSKEIPFVKEILLSGAGEVEIATSLPCEDERYLKELFGEKARFLNGY